MLIFCSIYLVCNTRAFWKELWVERFPALYSLMTLSSAVIFCRKLKDFTFWSYTHFAAFKWVSIHGRMKVRERYLQCRAWRMGSISQSCCHKWWLLGQHLTDLMDMENEWFFARFCFPNGAEEKLIAEVEWKGHLCCSCCQEKRCQNWDVSLSANAALRVDSTSSNLTAQLQTSV